MRCCVLFDARLHWQGVILVDDCPYLVDDLPFHKEETEKRAIIGAPFQNRSFLRIWSKQLTHHKPLLRLGFLTWVQQTETHASR